VSDVSTKVDVSASLGDRCPKFRHSGCLCVTGQQVPDVSTEWWSPSHWTTGTRNFDRVVVSVSLGDRCPMFRQSGCLRVTGRQVPDVSTQSGLRVTGRQVPDVSIKWCPRVTGREVPTFRHRMVVSASLGDRCPIFRHRVVVSSPKEEKTRKNDFMDFSTV